MSGRSDSRGYGGGLTGTWHQRGGGFGGSFVDLGQQARVRVRGQRDRGVAQRLFHRVQIAAPAVGEGGRDVTQIAEGDGRQLGGGKDASERLGDRLRVQSGAVLVVVKGPEADASGPLPMSGRHPRPGRQPSPRGCGRMAGPPVDRGDRPCRPRRSVGRVHPPRRHRRLGTAPGLPADTAALATALRTWLGEPHTRMTNGQQGEPGQPEGRKSTGQRGGEV